MKKTLWHVNSSEKGMTLEKYLRSHLETFSLEQIQNLLTEGKATLCGTTASGSESLNESDEVALDLGTEVPDSIIFSFEKNIIYEDSNIIIVNKPKGLLVQRNIAFGPSLESYGREYLTNKGESSALSAAHRLDRATSGLVIFGKNGETLSLLGTALMNRVGIKKKYWALVEGATAEEGEIDSPLWKNKETGIVEVKDVSCGGKESHTLYKKIASYEGYSLLEVTLLSGRTHQIRAHMKSIGHPLVGDPRYGNPSNNELISKNYGVIGQFLIAHEIDFEDLPMPLSYLNEKKFFAPLPIEEEEMLKKLKRL